MVQPQAPKNVEPIQTNMPVGEILRRARLHYNQSAFDIERALRIKATQIEAIETGRFNDLPGRVYTIGFIRTYAEYLGLDGDRMVELYKAQSGAKVVKPDLHFPTTPANEARIPHMWLVGGSLAAATVVLIVWAMLSTHDRAIVTEIPPVTASIRADSQSVTPAPAAAPVAAPLPGPVTVASGASAEVPEIPETSATAEITETAPVDADETVVTAAPAEANAQDGIILKIVQNSWVEIKDSQGKPVVSRVLKAGDKYFVPDRPDLYMSLGNSGGVQVEIDGETLSALGARGQVLRNVPLDAAALKKKFAPSVKPAAR